MAFLKSVHAHFGNQTHDLGVTVPKEMFPYESAYSICACEFSSR